MAPVPQEEILLEIPGRQRAENPLTALADPHQDSDWDTEAFSSRASTALAHLAKAITGETAVPKEVLVPGQQWPSLRPATWASAFDDPLVHVKRGRGDGAPSLEAEDAWASLFAPWHDAHDKHVKCKIVGVKAMGGHVMETEVVVESHARTAEGKVAQQSRWQCEWKWAGQDESQPLLRSLVVEDCEEITTANGGIHFADRTADLLGNDPAFQDQLQRGADYWRLRLQLDFGSDVNGLQGIAVGDADGDGWDDVYLCQPGGLPNRLYIRQDDGTLKDRSAAAGVDWMELTRAALFLDLDNDGDQDLALAQDSYYVLMENQGKPKQPRFRKRLEVRAPAKLRSLTAADIDLDGDLDLFFCGRNPASDTTAQGVLGFPLPYHDANNGGPNVLLRNDGSWQFSDQTVALGMDVNNRRFSYACAWEDFDNDGDQDLYVANDFGRNNLYRNDLSTTGRFTDVAAAMGVEDLSAGMGVTWADVNRDGWMDLYVSNMFSSAGNRVAYQRHFRDGDDADLKGFQRHARGNSLFLNRQGETFDDVSEPSRVTLGRWSWGSLFADFNNDGWEDLYVANGFITTPDTGDL